MHVRAACLPPAAPWRVPAIAEAPRRRRRDGRRCAGPAACKRAGWAAAQVLQHGAAAPAGPAPTLPSARCVQRRQVDGAWQPQGLVPRWHRRVCWLPLRRGEAGRRVQGAGRVAAARRSLRATPAGALVHTICRRTTLRTAATCSQTPPTPRVRADGPVQQLTVSAGGAACCWPNARTPARCTYKSSSTHHPSWACAPACLPACLPAVWGDAVKDNQVTYDYKPLDPEVNRVRVGVGVGVGGQHRGAMGTTRCGVGATAGGACAHAQHAPTVLFLLL